MTHCKGNESYFNKKNYVQNQTLIFKIYTVRTKDGTAKTYKYVTLKSRYYDRLNVNTNDRTTNKNEE